jgi:deoxyhypusine synthase
MTLKSLFRNAPDIIPRPLEKGMTIDKLLDHMGQTSFEARNLFYGAELFKNMILEDDTIWLGIAGAGIAGGMGGIVVSLLEAGFINVICSTGAQVYHDLHFAFDLPVKSISPSCDDNLLRQHGDTRIYDIGIREKETLEAQDEIIREFIRSSYSHLSKPALASWEFNFILGRWVKDNARYRERSFVVKAAELEIPIFWDSLSNHSIAMNLIRTDRQGYPVTLSAQKDIFDSAAIAFSSGGTSFFELGGGGPKNFIQQTGPTISQILSTHFDGADRGLQISTASEKEGSLSSCTFGEAVTWGKYRSADPHKLVQIWGEYSIIFPLLAAYVIELCPPRKQKKVVTLLTEFIETLENAL